MIVVNSGQLPTPNLEVSSETCNFLSPLHADTPNDVIFAVTFAGVNSVMASQLLIVKLPALTIFMPFSVNEGQLLIFSAMLLSSTSTEVRAAQEEMCISFIPVPIFTLFRLGHPAIPINGFI